MSLILDGTNGLSDVDGSAATPAIRGSDANTGVFFGSDIVGLSTGGSERVRVDASGNVGIGTSSPNFKLDVVSGAISASRARSNTAGDMALLLAPSDSTIQYGFRVDGNTNNLNLDSFVGGSYVTRAVLDASGNVGIGTSSPQTRLDVFQANAKSATGVWQIQTFDSTSQTTGVGGGISFSGYKTAQSAAEVFAGIDGYKENATAGNAAGALRFHTQVAGGSGLVERARIDSSGNFQMNSGYGSVATAYGCRAWVNFNGTGTPAIRASGNVSSITDRGTGEYTVNFTTAMPDANYCAVLAHENIDFGGTTFIQSAAGVTTSSIQVASYDINGTKYQDTDVYCVSIFR
jgi:hypothetical protein